MAFDPFKDLSDDVESAVGTANTSTSRPAPMDDDVRLARIHLLQKYQQGLPCADLSLFTEAEALPPLPVRLKSKKDIFRALREIAIRYREYGMLGLKSTTRAIDASQAEGYLLQKGLEYMAGGIPPEINGPALQNLKKCLLRRLDTSLDIILQGLQAIHTGQLERIPTPVPAPKPL